MPHALIYAHKLAIRRPLHTTLQWHAHRWCVAARAMQHRGWLMHATPYVVVVACNTGYAYSVDAMQVPTATITDAHSVTTMYDVLATPYLANRVPPNLGILDVVDR